MTETEMLLDYMNANKEEFKEILKNTVIIETPTEGSKEDLKACRDYFEKVFTEIGCKCTVVPSNSDKAGDHLLIEYGEGTEQILFVGHYDTVYAKGTFGELWTEKENKIFGPGVLDMKGGDVQVYMVIKALKELGLMPENKKIAFLLSADEESGSYTSHMHYEELAKKSKATFVMESANGDYIGGLKKGRFGRGNYTFHAKGITAHSGLEPQNAESGLIELAKQAVYLEGLTDMDKVVTVACTCLNSGDACWPTVPGEGDLTIDARFSKVEYAEEFDALANNLKPFNPKVSITTNGGIEKPPFDENRPDNKALYELAKKIGIEEFGIEMKGQIIMGGSDGNFTSAVGCTTLDGMGMTGLNVHKPSEEYINIDQVPTRGAFVAKMALEVFRADKF